VHCPIYLISKDAPGTQNVVLAYDGSVSSIYAIKMYSYLFMGFRDLHTYLVYISSAKNGDLPHEKEVKMWLSGHYRNLEIKILHGDVINVLADFTGSLPHSLVVMGSYGRNSLSRFFHKSAANKMIKEGKSSVFMTHQ
jgi:hypothetical protein